MGSVSQNRIVKAENSTTIPNLTDSMIQDDGSGTILINPVTPANALIHLQDAWGGGDGKTLNIWGSCVAGGDYNGGHILLNPGSRYSTLGNNGGVGIQCNSPKGLLHLAGSYVVAHAPSNDTSGVTDLANIMAAIAAVGGTHGAQSIAGTVYLQAGDYYINGPIDLDLIYGINIIGAGTGTTKIHIINNSQTAGFDLKNNQFCNIRNLSIISPVLEPKIHIGIRLQHVWYASVENVEIDGMDIGILLTGTTVPTDGSAINTFRDICVNSCNTGVKVGETGGANWANSNFFYGGKIGKQTGCTRGIWFCNGASNVVYGLDITGSTSAGVDFEAAFGHNSINGCHLESNSVDVRIASLHNKILDCYFCSDDGTYIQWASGYDAATSGNIFFANRFNNWSSPGEIILSNVGIGAAPDTDGQLCVVNSSEYNRIKFYNYSSDDYCTVLSMSKSHSDTVGTKTTTQDNDRLGMMEWFGVNGNATPEFAKGAQIVVSQDGNAGTDHVPALIAFKVATSSSNVASAMVIRSSRAVGIGLTEPASGLHLGASAGGSNKGYITEENIGQTPTLTVDGQMAIYSKGNKICIAKMVSGTTRYTSIDMSGNGNSWSTSTTTAP